MNVFAVDAGKIWSSLSEDCFQGGLVVCTRCIWKLREQCHSKTEMQYMQYSAFGKDLSLAFLFLPTSMNSVTQQNRRWSTLLVQSSLGFKLFVSISSRWLTCWLRLTDWVLLPLPPRRLLKTTVSRRTITQIPEIFSTSASFDWTPYPEHRAQLCCMSTLCYVCVHVRGCRHNHTYCHLQFAVKPTAVMKESQSNEEQYEPWQGNSFSTAA